MEYSRAFWALTMKMARDASKIGCALIALGIAGATVARADILDEEDFPSLA